MPTQHVSCAADPALLLARSARGDGAVLLDGGDENSWGTGCARFTAAPRATLAVYASGQARWRRGAEESWQEGAPLEEWQRFLAEAPARLPDGGDPDAVMFVTTLGYDLKHWIERLPRRHAWPD